MSGFEPLATSSLGPSALQCTPRQGGDICLEGELKNIAFHMNCVVANLICYKAKDGAILIATSSETQPLASGRVVNGQLVINMMNGSDKVDFEEAVKISGYTLENEGWVKPLFSRSVVNDSSFPKEQ